MTSILRALVLPIAAAAVFLVAGPAWSGNPLDPLQWVCGNGYIDPGEQCDLGATNGAPGSCCGSSCELSPFGSGCSFRIFHVNATHDDHDTTPGNGVCATSTGACTLRAAVEETASSNLATAVHVPSGLFQVNLPSNQSFYDGIYYTGTAPLSIVGEGSGNTKLAFTGTTPRLLGAPFPPFCYSTSLILGAPGFYGETNIALSAVTLLPGSATLLQNCSGVAGVLDPVERRAVMGLAALNRSVVIGGFTGAPPVLAVASINNCVIRDSVSTSQAGGVYSSGGVIRNSAIVNNQFSRPGCVSGCVGGGFGGSGTIINSTVSYNFSSNAGGGIAPDLGVTLINTTVTHNACGDIGCAAGVLPGITAINSLLTDNEGPDCAPPFRGAQAEIVSLGYNAIGNNQCFLSGDLTGNLIGDALHANLGLLDPLTYTQDLLAGSNAIDAGSPTIYPGFDQRGVSRPRGARSDIGAVETVAHCGNLYREAWLGEDCDDGNTVDGDGCNSACKIESQMTGGATGAGQTFPPSGPLDATGSRPFEFAVAIPAGGTGGTITVTQTSGATQLPGYQFLGGILDIVAPPQTPLAPLVITFHIDASQIPAGRGASEVQVSRNGTIITALCSVTTPGGPASPDPCVSRRTVLPDGDAEIEVRTSAASEWAFALPVCPSVPLAQCRKPIKTGKAKLQIKRQLTSSGDRLAWTWGNGEATPFGSFGAPNNSSDYALCLYDTQGITPRLELSTLVPAGSTCDGVPCWRQFAKGFKYSSKATVSPGLQQMILTAGSAGRAKIKIKGKGTALALPMLPLSPKVTLQLENSSGECWEATYSNPTKNDTTQFNAKSD